MNDHFNKLKTIYEKQGQSNDIDNLLNCADKQCQEENVAAKNKYLLKNYLGQYYRPRYQFPQIYLKYCLIKRKLVFYNLDYLAL